jgi:hypothetical protein
MDKPKKLKKAAGKAASLKTQSNDDFKKRMGFISDVGSKGYIGGMALGKADAPVGDKPKKPKKLKKVNLKPTNTFTGPFANLKARMAIKKGKTEEAYGIKNRRSGATKVTKFADVSGGNLNKPTKLSTKITTQTGKNVKNPNYKPTIKASDVRLGNLKKYVKEQNTMQYKNKNKKKS